MLGTTHVTLACDRIRKSSSATLDLSSARRRNPRQRNDRRIVAAFARSLPKWGVVQSRSSTIWGVMQNSMSPLGQRAFGGAHSVLGNSDVMESPGKPPICPPSEGIPRPCGLTFASAIIYYIRTLIRSADPTATPAATDRMLPWAASTPRSRSHDGRCRGRCRRDC